MSLTMSPYPSAEWAAAAMSAEAALAAATTPAAAPGLQPEALAAAGFAAPEGQGVLLLGGMLHAFPMAQPPLALDAGFEAAAGAGLHLAAAAVGLEDDDELELPPAEEAAGIAALLADLPIPAAAPQPDVPAPLGGTGTSMLAPLLAVHSPATAAGAAPSLAAEAVQPGPPAAAAAAGPAAGLCPSPSAELALDGHEC